jgi:transposase
MHKADGREGRWRIVMTTSTWCLGIDIAKATMHVCLRSAEGRRRHKRFTNDQAGVSDLVAWLAQHADGVVHACLEATGTYGDLVATTLHDAGHRVSVVNPAAIHAYAHCQLRRAKTDRVDADVIADYTAAERPAPWTPWPADVRVLQALVRRRDAVQDMLTQELNRRQAGELVAPIRTSLARHIRQLEKEVAALDRQIQDHIDQHPTLRAQRTLLVTIPGIGPATVARLLAECRSITDFANARAYAAFAGLVPRPVQSGTWRAPAHLSKIGSARVRYALYFPALSALRHNPVLKAFGARLGQAGKHRMVIVAAAMRKLLHIVYGVLKHQRPFDPALTS